MQDTGIDKADLLDKLDSESMMVLYAVRFSIKV
jgi:hypothetical protein